MSSSSPWDAYSQHTGLPAPLESYPHPFSSDMRSLAGNSASMSNLQGEGILGYPKSGELAAMNLTSPYAAYGQCYSGVSDLGFPGSSIRPSSTAHSPGSDNLPASSPHGQYSSTPNSDNQSSPPSFPSSTSLFTPSTITSSISSSPYAASFGGATSSTETSTRGPFSQFAQSYGYPMYGYGQAGSFPTSGSLDGVNRYMAGISPSSLMQPSMGLYSNSQPGQMPFPYPSMGWGPTIQGFQLKESSDLMSSDELERYRYRQLSNPYFSGLPPSGSPVRNFPHALQPGMIRTPPFLDDRTHSPPPKKPKKSAEEAERPPTPAPRDPASFHSHRGIYLFSSNAEPGSPDFFSDRYMLFEKELCEKLSRISLPGKIQYVYNPLEYAFDSHLNFVRRFCTGEKYILFVGMNPGPFGMSQNGVPFGECAVVKEWLHIDGEVSKPVLEHPKRRVVGLECSRSEVTGGRFWQLFRTLCHSPEHFFRTSYVHTLCPFAFLTDTGKNVTPPQLTSSVLDQINALCNATLVDVVRLLKSKYVICIGKYALAQAQKALSGDEFSGITLECLMHPSPINPAANKGWADIAIKQLTEIGVVDIIRYGRVPYQPPSQPPPSSASATQHPHHQYHNKQSPGHYYQSSPAQSYHGSTAQSSANHQSPVQASPVSQSPAHSSSRNQSSPAHGLLRNQSPAHSSSRNQSPAHGSSCNQSSPAHSLSRNQSSPAHALSRNQSPVHSSCSQSPAQQQASHSQSPNQKKPNMLPTRHGDQSAESQNVNKETLCAEQSQEQDVLKSSDVSHDSSVVPQINTNGIPDYSSTADELENSVHNSGSPGSDSSRGNSPDMAYLSGNSQDTQHPALMTVSGSHISSGMQVNTGSQQQMHHNIGSVHPHMDMGIPLTNSPDLHQGGQLDQRGSLTDDQIGSPQMKTPNSHIVPHNSHLSSMNYHMGSSVGANMQMGVHGMGMHSHMGLLNPYGQMDVGQMSSYGAGMSLGNYSGSPGMRPDMTGYGHHMGLHNPGMSGMYGGRQMFSHHMGPAGGEHLAMYPGMNPMHDSQLSKELPYPGHYLDKPPECS